MIRTWLILACIAAVIQIILAFKKLPQIVGFVIPIFFLGFAIYAWCDLSKIGMDTLTKLSFMIPPVFLSCIFEIFYWRRRWRERE